ncbi:MAG: LacI family DNA-binding transcriptional regulator [Pseudomonadota bacterium]
MADSSVSSRKQHFATTKRHVTSYDVARHAGVSQSAVSRCFKPGASVSKRMRDRVMRSVEELGYQPNAIARGLITRRSNMVAVIVSNLNFYPEVLSELSARFTERGVHVLLFTLDHESDVGRTIEQVAQYQVDGVLAAAHLTAEQIARFEQRNVPLVFYNRAYQDVAVSSVCCDQVEGERFLVNMLVETNTHSSYAIVSGPADSVVSMQRTQGAIDRLKALGVQDIVEINGDYSYESGRKAIQNIADQRTNMVDAIICANDMMAFGCLDELRFHRGFAVPDEISVVGFDGVRAAQWASFDLTTVQQPVERMADAAVAMLMDHIDKPGLPPEKRMFSGVLRAGKTVRR